VLPRDDVHPVERRGVGAGAEVCRLTLETVNAGGPDQSLLRDSAAIDARAAKRPRSVSATDDPSASAVLAAA
jgi:hypothetical protein